MKIELIVKDATPEQVAAIFAMAGAIDTRTAALAPAIASPPLPVAPAPLAPVATAPAAAPAPVAAQYDKLGIPWDQRIHSEKKNFNKDGSWRYRRNLDNAVKASVEAELRASGAVLAAPTPVAPVVASAAPVAVTQPAAPVAPNMHGAPPLPPAVLMPQPVAPNAAPPVPQPVASGVPDYKTLIDNMTAMVTGGKINPANLGAIYAECGVAGPADFMTNENARSLMATKLAALALTP